LLHAVPVKYFHNYICYASNERKKNNKPYPHCLRAFAQAMNHTNNLQPNNDIIIVVVKKKHFFSVLVRIKALAILRILQAFTKPPVLKH